MSFESHEDIVVEHLIAGNHHHISNIISLLSFRILRESFGINFPVLLPTTHFRVNIIGFRAIFRARI